MSTDALILNREFSREFDWRGERLRVAFLKPGDGAKISEALKGLSPETIRQRFFGPKNGFTDAELKRLTHLDGDQHFALGIAGPLPQELGLGIVRMVRDPAKPDEAEIALIVVDSHQKRGLGTLMMELCLVAAAERGIRVLRFSYLPGNEAVEKLARKGARVEVHSPYPGIKEARVMVEPTAVGSARTDLSSLFQ